MIVQDTQTENKPATLDVRQTIYYQETFEINFHFPIFNDAYTFIPKYWIGPRPTEEHIAEM